MEFKFKKITVDELIVILQKFSKNGEGEKIIFDSMMYAIEGVKSYQIEYEDGYEQEIVLFE